jgi:hypothetical protein
LKNSEKPPKLQNMLAFHPSQGYIKSTKTIKATGQGSRTEQQNRASGQASRTEFQISRMKAS